MERVVGQVRHREPSHGAVRAAQRKVLGARMKEEESLNGTSNSKNWYQLHRMDKREKQVKMTRKLLLILE